MADEKTDNLSSRLDDVEKHDIITDEELEEIGALYGSREKYEETMRYLASRLSRTQTRRHTSVSVGMGRTQAGINQGTSTVLLGDISGIKKINIAGKVINTADDAALLLSDIRDPRIEIFNIVYTSKTGEILAHSAWTNGLPGFVSAIDDPSPGRSQNRILKIKETLNAEKIWIAHNHPSGDPAPSDQDIVTTRAYASRFGDAFGGHIVLDHDKYSFITPNGMVYENKLRKPVNNFISAHREQAEEIKSPAHFASIFKEILSGNEDVTAYAILDNAHKIVSWVYGDSDNTAELKNYMRISGGSLAVALTNSETAYRNIFADACNAFDTNNDIFLDVIKVNRSAGTAEKSLAEKTGPGGKWQLHESKQVKYIINNQSINTELKLDNISNNNPSVYEDQEKFYIKNDIVKQISNKEQIMTKEWEEKSDKEQKQLINEWIKGRQNDHRYPVNLGNDRYKIRFSDNSEGIFSQEQIDGFYKIYRANQLINEKAEVQKDGSLRISSEDWRGINRKLNEKNIEKNKLFEDALRNIANEEKNTKNFWRVRYQVDTKKKENASDINLIYTFDGKPKPEFLESGSILQYSEYFNSSDEPIAYKKMQSFQTGEFTNALNSLLEKRNQMEIDQLKKWHEEGKKPRDLIQALSKTGDPDAGEAADIIQANPVIAKYIEERAINTYHRNYGNKQSKSPPLERRNINSKENFMSRYDDPEEESHLREDERESFYEERDAYNEEMEAKARDPKEQAFLNTVHQRKVIADALKAGKLSCLPGEGGFADTQPAVNMVNGTLYHGTNLLFLKEHQKQNGFPSAEYVTAGQIEKAHKDNPDLFIRKGQKGVSIYVSEKNEETGEYENKNFRLFNVAQTTKPAVMKEWAEQQRQEKLQEKLEYLQTQYGTGYKLPEPKEKGPGPEIVCSSTEPVKYLGQYLAAVSLGGKFKASPEQSAEFAQKLEGTLFERMENGHTNPFKLEKISIEASRYCKEFKRDFFMEARKAEQPQQQEQTQSRGRGL